MAKWVYCFGGGTAEGTADMPELLGGKGACLAQMSRLGLPVPPGFTITTKAWGWCNHHEQNYPDGLRGEVVAALQETGRLAGRCFGAAPCPLLVSVRSGACVSMPGMMDTILNIGMNDETARTLAAQAGPDFAYGAYRRFIQRYSDAVLGIDPAVFEDALEDVPDRAGPQTCLCGCDDGG